jgi:hypothetical protein
MTFYGPISEWGLSKYSSGKELELVLLRHIPRADISRGVPLKTFLNTKKFTPEIPTRKI